MIIKVRKANRTDIERVFELSNEPSVRAVSFSQTKITWEDHIEWFNKAIQDEKLLFFVGFTLNGEDEVDFIGQVRFKYISKEEVELSISICKNFRGLGLGKVLIEQGMKNLKENGRIKLVLARVQQDNHTSVALFKTLGFIQLVNEERSTDILSFVKNI